MNIDKEAVALNRCWVVLPLSYPYLKHFGSHNKARSIMFGGVQQLRATSYRTKADDEFP